MKLYVHTEIHTQTAAFTATFFLIAKTRKQPACLLAGESINTLHLDGKILFITKKKWAVKLRKDMEES